MHASAWIFGNLFFTWVADLLLIDPQHSPIQIVDIGSYDVNGNLRTALEYSELKYRYDVNYTGVDMSEGKNVDVVLKDPYDIWPFEHNSIDIVISSSALEHDSMFWLTFLKMVEILKPGGYMLISVPCWMPAHRYPMDNWRFLNDSSQSLLKWASYNNHNLSLVYSSILPNEKLKFDEDYKEYKAFTDIFMIFWKNNHTTTTSTTSSTTTTTTINDAENDMNTAITSSTPISTSISSQLIHSFHSITYSFLLNLENLAISGNYSPLPLLNELLALERVKYTIDVDISSSIDSDGSHSGNSDNNSSSSSSSSSSIDSDTTSILAPTIVLLNDTILSYINCEYLFNPVLSMGLTDNT